MTKKLRMRTIQLEFEDRTVRIGVLKSWMYARKGPLLDTLGLVQEKNEKHGTSMRLISPRVANHLLLTSRWDGPERALNFPVAAAVAYEAPDKPFGDEVVFVPEQGPKVILATGGFKGERNAALVALDITAENLQIEGNETRILVPEESLILVSGFPPENGWYVRHAETTIAHGEKVLDSADGSGPLFRLDSSYVGLPVRSDKDMVYASRKTIALTHTHGTFGVLVEIPEADSRKIKDVY